MGNFRINSSVIELLGKKLYQFFDISLIATLARDNST